MYSKNIQALSFISAVREKREGFHKNFKSVAIIHHTSTFKTVFVDGYQTKTIAGPITFKELNKILAYHDIDADDILYIIYTFDTGHYILKDDRLLTVVKDNQGLSSSVTKDAKASWVRLQGFMYGYTDRSVSHARKSPNNANGFRSLDAFVKEYQSSSCLF